jgi:hypothetical protein
MIIQRAITSKLLKSLTHSPVTLLTGARQVGKTFLMQEIAKQLGYHFVSFDDIRFLAAAKSDPIGFIEDLKKPVIIDEIQRAPELFLPIKHEVDRNRAPGRYLLTGSSNILLLPRLGDSLAGRMVTLQLYPLSQGEINGYVDHFVDAVFRGTAKDGYFQVITRTDLFQRMTKGGYPGVQLLDEEAREQFFDGYIRSLLERDVMENFAIAAVADFPGILNLLATRVGGLANIAELARSSRIPSSTVRRYVTLLERIYLITQLPSWSVNRVSRLVKSPKSYVVDTGLLAHLLGIRDEALENDPNTIGGMLENFVVGELLKQATWSTARVSCHYFRTQNGIEVDLVLEDARGMIVGIEVKGSQTVGNNDFKGLKYLQSIAGKKFQRGYVLYTGSETIPFGKSLYALPISSLWAGGSS